MKNLLIVLLVCCAFGFTGITGAAELSAQDKKLLKEINIPVYPAAQFVNGSLAGMTGVRFATSDTVKKVRNWYREIFPKWAVDNRYGTWILYNGKPDGGPAEYMSKNQVMVIENKNLQQWFGLPASMTTEIVIMLPLIQ